jgi:hypothetical protein
MGNVGNPSAVRTPPQMQSWYRNHSQLFAYDEIRRMLIENPFEKHSLFSEHGTYIENGL